jgi:hypothetical protein
MAAKTLPLDDKHLRATFTTRFLVRLNQLADRGTIERIGSGNGVRWRLAAGLSAPAAAPLSWHCNTVQRATLMRLTQDVHD